MNEIIEIIEKEYKKSSKKPKDDDFKYIEVISSIDILNALIKQLESKGFAKLESYISKAQDYEEIKEK